MPARISARRGKAPGADWLSLEVPEFPVEVRSASDMEQAVFSRAPRTCAFLLLSRQVDAIRRVLRGVQGNPPMNMTKVACTGAGLRRLVEAASQAVGR